MRRLWNATGAALALLGYALLVVALCIAICGYVEDCQGVVP